MGKTRMVRVSGEDTEILTRIGEKIGVSQAQLVRWAIEALIADVEERGEITLPYRFIKSLSRDCRYPLEPEQPC